MIEGLNHLTFATSDLERAFRFYRDVLGFRPLAKWARGAYFLAGREGAELWCCLSLDPDSRKTPHTDYTHTAFAVSPQNFEEASQKIRDSGAPIWKENKSEGDSLYFLDPDGHKLEIHATSWRERLASTKIKPYDGMVFFE